MSFDPPVDARLPGSLSHSQGHRSVQLPQRPRRCALQGGVGAPADPVHRCRRQAYLGGQRRDGQRGPRHRSAHTGMQHLMRRRTIVFPEHHRSRAGAWGCRRHRGMTTAHRRRHGASHRRCRCHRMHQQHPEHRHCYQQSDRRGCAPSRASDHRVHVLDGNRAYPPGVVVGASFSWPVGRRLSVVRTSEPISRSRH